MVVADGAQLPAGMTGPTGTTSLRDAVGFLQNASGAVAGPFDAWLTLRGLKTLAVRMDRHCANAAAVAAFLARAIRFTDIAGIAEQVLGELPGGQIDRLDQVLALDAEARRRASDAVAARRRNASE